MAKMSLGSTNDRIFNQVSRGGFKTKSSFTLKLSRTFSDLSTFCDLCLLPMLSVLSKYVLVLSFLCSFKFFLQL